MCHTFLSTASFWSLLFRIDEDLAAEARAAGCASCGGVLHSARYPRKPRGIAGSVLGDQYARRLSFCCEREGCRRRTTPPSVRFLGRRVFLGAVVVLATALAAGLTGRRVAALYERFGVSVRTLAAVVAGGVGGERAMGRSCGPGWRAPLRLRACLARSWNGWQAKTWPHV